jgi:tetratricopeptide (TPR) repeat protein
VESCSGMKHSTYIVLAFTLFVSASVAGAQTPPRPAASADPVLSDASFTKGIEALHNLDFPQAQRHFEEVQRRYRDHPAGPYYLAANLFLETLMKPERLLPLLSNLSRSKTFDGKFENKGDQETTQRFRTLTRQADRLSKARLQRNSRDFVALYFQGTTQGLMAAFKGTLEGSITGAMRDGSDGVDKHREVLRLNPDFHDAELSIGLYDYTVGALPFPIKVMAAIANIRGSKKRGLETLERVGREGDLERYISRIILVVLYKREKRYSDAIERSRELTIAYPRNYLFKLAHADALISEATVQRTNNPSTAANLEREAFTMFESLLKTQAAHNAPAELIHFIHGEALLKAGHAERAARQYMAAAAAPQAEASIATIAHLRSAQAFDLAGKRREALTQYETVLKRPDAYDSRERASQGVRKPYRE